MGGMKSNQRFGLIFDIDWASSIQSFKYIILISIFVGRSTYMDCLLRRPLRPPPLGHRLSCSRWQSTSSKDDLLKRQHTAGTRSAELRTQFVPWRATKSRKKDEERFRLGRTWPDLSFSYRTSRSLAHTWACMHACMHAMTSSEKHTSSLL